MAEMKNKNKIKLRFRIKFFLVNYLILLVCEFCILILFMLGKFPLFESILLLPVCTFGIVVAFADLYQYREELMEMEDAVKRHVSRSFRRAEAWWRGKQ